MKYLLIFLSLLLLNGCYFTNIQIINVPASIFRLPCNNNRISIRKLLTTKTVYKLKNGMIIDKYRKNYGYWYRIRRGDSLSRISQRNGLRIKTLARANRIRINARLKYKAYLFIPMSEKYLNKKAEKIIINLKTGDFIWPTKGRISSGFGLRKWGWRKKFHKGIDIAAPPGTKVMSSMPGNVSWAGYKKGYGYVIIVKHKDNFETRYAHLKRVLVKKGEKVNQGQIIGLVGKTGRSTGYHLHFEIRINNYPVNPIDYLPKNKKIII